MECYRWSTCEQTRFVLYPPSLPLLTRQKQAVWETGVTSTLSEWRMHNYLPSIGLFTLYSGLGLLEYMYFCEDLGMEPIMAVWSGLYFLSRLKSHVSTMQVILSMGRAFLKTNWRHTFKPPLIRSTSSVVIRQLMNMVRRDLSI